MGEPGVRLLLVEGRDGSHVVVRQVETEDVDVGAQTLGVGALRDREAPRWISQRMITCGTLTPCASAMAMSAGSSRIAVLPW